MQAIQALMNNGVIRPPNISGLLLSLLADARNTLDQSGQGNVIVETGGSPVFAHSDRFANFLTMNFSLGKCLLSTGPCQAYRIGADKPWTQVLVWRTLSVASTQQLMGWSNQNGPADQIHLTLGQTGAPRRYQNVLRDDAGLSTTVNSTSLWNAAPEILIVECDGTNINWYKNGVADGAAVQNRGVFTPNSYNFFCRNANSGLDASGVGDVAAHYVYDNAIGLSNRNLWSQWAFNRYGISASGAVGPTQKVGFIIGQSNARKAGTATLQNGSKVRGYSLDQFWRQNPSFSQNDVAPVFNGVFGEGLGPSVNWGLFACDELAGTIGGNYGLITNAKGSTGTGGAGPASPDNWFPSTDTDNLYGAAFSTIQKAALLSGATPQFALIDIGEEDSKSAVSPWGTGYGNIYTAIRTDYPGIPIFIRRLRATNPNPGLYLDWSGTRAAQLAANNPSDDVYVIDSSDNSSDYEADGVHFTHAYEEFFGRNEAAPVMAPVI